MKKIAVLNLGYIGDVINSSPVCIELKKNYPDSKLIFITMSTSYETAKCIPGVDEVLVYDRRGQHKGLISLIKIALSYRLKETIDSIVILDNSLRSAFFAYLLGAKKRIGRTGQGRSFLLTHKIPHTKEEMDMQIHVTEHYMRILKPIGLYNQEYKMNFIYSEENEAYIDKILALVDYSDNNLIGLCPCGRYEHKNWDVKEAIRFINYINKETNLKVVVVGDKSCSWFCEKLKESGTDDFLDLTGKTTIPQLGALIDKFHKFVSVDTGPMHMAYALNIPTVALFHHSIMKKWGPNDLVTNRVIYSPVGKTISAEQVINEFNSLPAKPQTERSFVPFMKKMGLNLAKLAKSILGEQNIDIK